MPQIAQLAETYSSQIFWLLIFSIMMWEYDEAARLPLSDDDLPAQGGRQDLEGKTNG